MRKTCMRMIYELARRDPRVVFVGSDLGAGVLDEFKRDFPQRFLMEGVSEANVIGLMAGLAANGHVPYLNTIATFITRRCLEQVAMDACLHRLPLRLIGSGGGLVYAQMGPTHQAVEDVAIMRALPNMTVVAVADAPEMERLMAASLDYAGPIYIRLAKGGDPLVSSDTEPFAIGRAVPMRRGRDALVVSTGVMLSRSLEAALALEARGVQAGVVHVHTVKPLDVEQLLAMAEGVRAVVTVEEHSILGGLGSATVEILAEHGILRQAGFRRLGLPDAYPDHYGSQDQLLQHYGVTCQAIVDTVCQLLEGVTQTSGRAEGRI
ncbi:MAG: transketolase family protein [Candidatus Xenobia bacterium]